MNQPVLPAGAGLVVVKLSKASTGSTTLFAVPEVLLHQLLNAFITAVFW